jgi:uncharacterized membrane protein (DUF2068 family)
MDTFDREIELASDPWLGWARTVLNLGGAFYLLMALGLGPLMSLQLWVDPNIPQGVAIGLTLVFYLMALVMCGGFAALQFAAASGLAGGRKWAWIAGLVVGAIYLPSCTCLPFGAVILFGLLNEKTRRLFS